MDDGYREYAKVVEVWREISELLLEIDRGKIEKLKDPQKKIFEAYELEKNALQILKMT